MHCTRTHRRIHPQPASEHVHDLRHGKHAQLSILLCEAIGAQERHRCVGLEDIAFHVFDRLLDELLEIDLVALSGEHLDDARRILRRLAGREEGLAHRRRQDSARRAVGDAGSLRQHVLA